ncbi:transcriptional regulator, TetR family [Dethiosulfatibacter aminovorans DSM 17477]|uniref:Transcriptional regulator, TetR family n=1 Tax=Dethiosulfatibacter aminovorans DSM 17477 TaxID=1121476 RepID=A0A1M6IJ07_9FIRM|nr:TetR/AcrR family transcriptional regulator [Dethiosulfatibacter aminovorans]SHJ34387.1 transcriptional regulator, TetR family [Dethiosulfatibacter aminovorans DSM 17477]
MRHKIVSKDQIIGQALKIIETEGPKKCSVRRLARELDVAVGTIYNYFDSREAFIVEAFMTSWTDTLGRLNSIAAKDGSRYELMTEIFEETMKDVRKRNELGKEILTIYMSQDNKYFKMVAEQLKEIAKKIVLKGCDSGYSMSAEYENSREESLVNLISLLLHDGLRTKKSLTSGDKALLKELLSPERIL